MGYSAKTWLTYPEHGSFSYYFMSSDLYFCPIFVLRELNFYFIIRYHGFRF